MQPAVRHAHAEPWGMAPRRSRCGSEDWRRSEALRPQPPDRPEIRSEPRALAHASLVNHSPPEIGALAHASGWRRQTLPEIFLGRLSNSASAIRLDGEGRAIGPPEEL